MATEDTAYNGSSGTHGISEEKVLITKGPWTEEEDSVLFSYITVHGEGHWNSVARCAGLKRTGKSCRLRWLNYLRPSVRRGNITLQEQLLILELHSRWGNRWSKIAEQIPGRTDNEIKNYWRTRVVKQAKLLKCDVNSKQFRDTMRFVWMPRMVERIKAHEASSSSSNTDQQQQQQNSEPSLLSDQAEHSSISSYSPLAHPYVKEAQCSLSPHSSTESYNINLLGGGGGGCSSYSSTATAEEGSRTTPWHWQQRSYYYSDIQQGNDFGTGADLWTDENICFLQQQLADHDV